MSAALVVAFAAAVGGLLFWGGASVEQLAAVAAWGVAGALGAWLLTSRRARDLAALEEAAVKIRAQAEASTAELQRLRARGSDMEREHRETLAFYGMIKALTEAITWDQLRLRLENAVEAYLGLTEYALYASAGPGKLRLLGAKRLDNSPGGRWVTLERYLQEHGLSIDQAHVSDKPEHAVGIPIQHTGETLGYFYARAPKGMTAAALLDKARGFADEIAFAFRRVTLFQEVENLSKIDGLTGVHRRGDFEERLRHELVRAKTFKTSLCLMLLDIDHFKRLNDRYGHPFGDTVLRRVGELLNASVYETDFVARYGGEEFVILLPRAEAEGALRKAEAIRHALEEERFALALETIKVTVSIGVAHFPRDASSPEELVAQADAALYAAKSQGRNRVVDCRALRAG